MAVQIIGPREYIPPREQHRRELIDAGVLYPGERWPTTQMGFSGFLARLAWPIKRRISWREEVFLQIFTILTVRYGHNVMLRLLGWFEDAYTGEDLEPGVFDPHRVVRDWERNALPVWRLHQIFRIGGTRKNPVLLPNPNSPLPPCQYTFDRVLRALHEGGLDIDFGTNVNINALDRTTQKVLTYQQVALISKELSPSEPA